MLDADVLALEAAKVWRIILLEIHMCTLGWQGVMRCGRPGLQVNVPNASRSYLSDGWNGKSNTRHPSFLSVLSHTPRHTTSSSV